MSPLTIRSSSPLRNALIILSGGVVMIVLCMYVLFQARFLIEGPRITLTDTPAILQEERMIELRGVAKNIVSITLNGRAIVTDEEGRFRAPVILQNGHTIVTIKAHDRYGRSTTHTEYFVYKNTHTET